MKAKINQNLSRVSTRQSRTPQEGCKCYYWGSHQTWQKIKSESREWNWSLSGPQLGEGFWGPQHSERTVSPHSWRLCSVRKQSQSFECVLYGSLSLYFIFGALETVSWYVTGLEFKILLPHLPEYPDWRPVSLCPTSFSFVCVYLHVCTCMCVSVCMLVCVCVSVTDVRWFFVLFCFVFLRQVLSPNLDVTVWIDRLTRELQDPSASTSPALELQV